MMMMMKTKMKMKMVLMMTMMMVVMMALVRHTATSADRDVLVQHGFTDYVTDGS